MLAKISAVVVTSMTTNATTNATTDTATNIVTDTVTTTNTTITTPENTSVNANKHDTTLYHEYIKDVAKKHYFGEDISFDDSGDDDFRDRVVQYGNNNKDTIRHMLYTIGYECYTTCTNYDAVREILCIIAGQPYFEYLINEINDKKRIQVNYYIYLLRNLVVYKEQSIYGTKYDIVFNSLNRTMRLEDSKQYKIMLEKSFVTKNGYTKLLFEAY